MESTKTIDAYSRRVLRQIAPEVRDTLSIIQMEAIVQAIKEVHPLKEHLVNIRGVLPFFRMRYYFVFLMGRDERRNSKTDENEGRSPQSLSALLLFSIFALSPLLLAMILFYFLIA
ncbi:MAG: hypothetical protein AB1656_12145 [Candidatus Omnitrophota bacterium]